MPNPVCLAIILQETGKLILMVNIYSICHYLVIVVMMK